MKTTFTSKELAKIAKDAEAGYTKHAKRDEELNTVRVALAVEGAKATGLDPALVFAAQNPSISETVRAALFKKQA